MSDTYELTAETRNEMGKGASRRLRRLGNKVPAIVYGGDRNPEMICLDHNVLSNALENEAFYSRILTLKISGKKEQVVLKDLHRHPSKPKILHADFLRIIAKNKITMSVPLHFEGAENSPGVKTQGGLVSHLKTDVEIRCLPADLPEFIEADLSKLSIGDSIRLSDLVLPKGIELTILLQGEEYDLPVAIIHKPTVGIKPEATTAPEQTSQPEATAQKTEVKKEA